METVRFDRSQHNDLREKWRTESVLEIEIVRSGHTLDVFWVHIVKTCYNIIRGL